MTSLPSSIAANVGQVGGAPGSAADVSSYLTQLGSSLNGFTGPVSNAINFLLQQSTLPPTSANWAPVATITQTLGTAIAWGIGAAGCVLTPARTGRVVCLASGNYDPQASTSAGVWQLNAQIYCGLGVPPAQASAGVPAGATAVGPNTFLGWDQSVTSQDLWMCIMCLGFTLGLSQTQTYWFDMFSTAAGTNAGLLVYGQMLVIEV